MHCDNDLLPLSVTRRLAPCGRLQAQSELQLYNRNTLELDESERVYFSHRI